MINAKRKAEEAERKAPRRVSRNLNIMDLSKLPANDDESDYSLNKITKTVPNNKKFRPRP